jgi:exodeoxyribonuclease V alpha subunit
MNERQATAVRRGLERNPLFVTGGPGTGKTTAAVHLVTALCFDRIERGAPPPRIRIAAPTGRAAARMADGFSRALRTNEPGLLDAAERAVDGWLPRTGFTLHRLLGPAMHRDSGGLDCPFRIDADILVVDEASMADIELFTLLWESLLPDARLILIGDPDQLPSVEAGSVFQDILPPKKGEGHFFSSHRVHLEVSHRSNAAIQEWARALSDGDAAFAARRFERSENPSDAGTESGGSVRVFDAADRGWEKAVVQFAERFGSSVPGETPPDAPFEPLDLPPGEWEGESEAVEEAFRRVNRYRILTATHRGPRGAVRVNELLERRFCPVGAELYPGRPLLVVKNDYENRLWNGDPGVVLDVKDEGLKAFFPSEKGFRKLSVARLRDFVTGYAVTVHKSQGSEYDAVMVVLPEEPIPLLSRELLYTALTRARRHLWIAGTREVFLHALRHPVRRESGIRGSLSQ